MREIGRFLMVSKTEAKGHLPEFVSGGFEQILGRLSASLLPELSYRTLSTFMRPCYNET